MLQVDLMLCIERGTLILPAGLPGYRASGDTNDLNVGIGACVAVTVPGMQLQLRLHDYFMGKPNPLYNHKAIVILSLSLGRNVTQLRHTLWRHLRRLPREGHILEISSFQDG
jgi:hypothetical protein